MTKTTLLAIPSSGTAGTASAQNYTTYSYSYTATASETSLSFEFRQDPSYWDFDDVSFVGSSGVNLIGNGGFESGNLNDWTVIGTRGLSAAGRVTAGQSTTGTGGSHTGSYYYIDGAVGGVDGIDQDVQTVAGQTYTITFSLANQHTGSGELFLAQATSLSAPSNLALVPDSGTIATSTTTDATPEITGIADVGQIVTILVDSVAVGTTTSDSTGAWSYSFATPLATGNRLITATEGNSSGQTAPSAPLVLDIAVRAPSTPRLAAASDTGVTGDDITADRLPAIIGTATAGDTVSLYDAGSLIGTSTVGTGGTWSITPAATLADGTHELTATATDGAGDASAASAALGLTIDSTPPAAPSALALAPSSDSGASGDGITNHDVLTLTGQGTAGDTITLYDGQSVVGSAVAAVDGSWSITSDPLEDGSHALTATATDIAGNVSVASSALDVITDTHQPAAPGELALAATSDSGTIGDDITNVTEPVLSGTGERGDTVVVRDGNTVIGSGTVDGEGHWSVTPAAPLAEGVHQLSADQTDAAGTTSAASAELRLTIDTTPPPAPVGLALAVDSDGGAIGDGLTNVTMPTIVGTGVPGETITLLDGDTVIGTGSVANDGGWSVTVATALANGSHSLTAISTDAAGNLSPGSVPFDLTIDDTTLAAVTLDQQATSTTPATPSLTGSAEAGMVVSIRDGDVLLGTTVVNQSGSYTFSLPAALAAGSHALTATQSDLAGNMSAASPVLAVQVDAAGSYSVTSRSADTGDTITRTYDGSGAYASVRTVNDDGLLVQTVTPTTTSRYIYDSNGTLIGTVSEAGSTTGIATPDFATQPETGKAITATDPSGSQVVLLSENHALTLAGSDVVSIDDGDDTISAGSGSVSVSGGVGRLLFNAGSGSSTVSGGHGTLTVVGGSGSGLYRGGDGAGNMLSAGSGNTTLMGGSSHDQLQGGAGSTTIIGSAGGFDTISGGAGATRITASSNETVYGGSGQTTITAHAGGDNLLVGTSGNDEMDASGNGNAMFGGSGNDTMFGGSGTATMVGGSGTALMVADTGNTEFVGGSGRSTVWGGTGTDVIWTGTGKMNAVESGDGNDTAILGSGSSTIQGGLGQDVYDIIAGGGGGDHTIAGFKVGIDQIRSIGFDPAITQRTIGSSTVLSLSDGTSITLLNVTHVGPASFT